MYAARARPRTVEERDRLRMLRRRDVEQLESGGLQPLFLRLIGDRHEVAAGLQRVRSHMGLRQIGLHHDLRFARIGYVDCGKILRRALVREPEDAPAIGRDLDRHALAHAAKAVERMLSDQIEIPGDGRIAPGLQRAYLGSSHGVLLELMDRGWPKSFPGARAPRHPSASGARGPLPARLFIAPAASRTRGCLTRRRQASARSPVAIARASTRPQSTRPSRSSRDSPQ